jgi:hypothetical protein
MEHELYFTDELLGLTKCWLSPKGEIIVGASDSDNIASHEQLALSILRNMRGGDEDRWGTYEWVRNCSEFLYAYEYLETLGYIRLHGFNDVLRARWIITQKMSFIQKQKIKLWCIVNKLSWDTAVKLF